MRSRPAGAAVPLALALACAPLAALAQSPSPIVPKERPDQSPVQPPPVAAPAGPSAQPAPPAMPEITPFQLQRVEVSGTSLPTEALQAAWRPFVGQTLGSPGVAAVTDAIIRAYEQSDIALYTVLVPSQPFTDGVLRINVIEGYVESVAVQGGEAKSKVLAERYLEQLTSERPLTKTTLQRYVSLTRDLPGVRTEMHFVGGGQTGAVRLLADLESRPVQLAVAANNRGVAFLGRTQVSADLFLNDLIVGGQTRLSAAAPTDFERFQYVALTQSQLLGTRGALLQANIGYLRTRPRGSDLHGEATSAGAQLTYPVVRSYDRDLYLTAGLDGLNANSALVGSTFSDDRTRAARFSVAYAQQDERNRVSLSGAASFGLDILGAKTLHPDLDEIRFFKLNARLGYARELADRIFVRLAAAGQWTDDRLPASEQFSLGGNEFGRGFEAAALTGDQGYAGSAEFAYRPAGWPALVQDAEAYAFVDGGETFYLRRALATTIHDDLSSMGLGVRATLKQQLALQIEATKPLRASIPALRHRGERLVISMRSVW